MYDRLRDRRPIQVGMRRALVHFAKAGYEVITGIGAFVEEVVSAVRDDGDDPPDRGPQRIEVD